MKRCPKCQRPYSDETLNFCRQDGTALERITSQSEDSTTILGVVSSERDTAETELADSSAGAPLRPPTRYAKSNEVNIAYQVIGDGALDLVYVMGWVSNLDYFWEEPSYARFLNRLASFCRVILFDKR